jgi:hypothetical protein
MLEQEGNAKWKIIYVLVSLSFKTNFALVKLTKKCKIKVLFIENSISMHVTDCEYFSPQNFFFRQTTDGA